VRLEMLSIARLAALVEADPAAARVTVDLRGQRVVAPDGEVFGFEIDAEAREMLLEGLDGIDLTRRFLPQIEAFQARDRVLRPWIYLHGE